MLADGWCHHCFPSPAPLMALISLCAGGCVSECVSTCVRVVFPIGVWLCWCVCVFDLLWQKSRVEENPRKQFLFLLSVIISSIFISVFCVMILWVYSLLLLIKLLVAAAEKCSSARIDKHSTYLTQGFFNYSPRHDAEVWSPLQSASAAGAEFTPLNDSMSSYLFLLGVK